MNRFLPLCILIYALCALPNSALDTNSNGMSDLWERRYNPGQHQGQLFDTNDTKLLPGADPDGDGWPNEQEAAAGTNPFDPNVPAGYIRPVIIHRQNVSLDLDNDGIYEYCGDVESITWPIIPGKQYTLQASDILIVGSWITVEQATADIVAERTYNFPLSQTATTEPPPRMFWRVAIEDVDSDGDGLTDAEEYELGTNPHLADTDGDGLPDGWEVANELDPLDNGSVNPSNGPNGDPDGDGLTNLLEWQHGGSARLKDTDDDGMDDGPEYYAGLNINDADQNHNGVTDGYEDFDDDGYTNREEAYAGTRPFDATDKPDGTNPAHPVFLVRELDLSVSKAL